MLEKIFRLKENRTTPRTEILAGLTTFLAMSYILAVNPIILGGAGMDVGAIFTATCVAAIIGTLIMAFVANWPVGMAPGMGLNAFFAYGVVAGMGYSWQQALGAVFLSGVIFIILTATGIRKWLINGVPQSLRAAIAAGIGMFLAMVALQNAGIIVKNDATLIGLGDMTQNAPLFASLGFAIIIALSAFHFRGAILVGILATTILSYILPPLWNVEWTHGEIAASIAENFKNIFPEGILSMPPSLGPTFLQLDISGILHTGVVHVLLVLVLVEIFDATGTLIGVGKRAGLIVDKESKGLSRALFADSSAILAGSLVGTSSTTAYMESVAGAEIGGRTGLTALTIAFFFFVALFFSPLFKAIPAFAVAPALIFVACMMMREFSEIQWDDITESVPAALTALIMPFTYSIANGLAFGFITYAVIKTLAGKWRDVHFATWIISILFIIRFIVE